MPPKISKNQIELHASAICWLYASSSKSMMKVRISIGASSTTSFSGSIGPPRTTLDSSVDEPSTSQTSLFFSISTLSWLADKLISFTSSIWDTQQQGHESFKVTKWRGHLERFNLLSQTQLLLPSCLGIASLVLPLLFQKDPCLLQPLHNSKNSNRKTIRSSETEKEERRGVRTTSKYQQTNSSIFPSN